MASLDGINGRSIQTLLRGENDSRQLDEFQASRQDDRTNRQDDRPSGQDDMINRQDNRTSRQGDIENRHRVFFTPILLNRHHLKERADEAVSSIVMGDEEAVADFSLDD